MHVCLEIVLEDEARDGPALAHPGAVPDEEASSVAVREEVVVLLRGVHDALQLQRRQLPLVNHVLGQRQLVPDYKKKYFLAKNIWIIFQAIPTLR